MDRNTVASRWQQNPGEVLKHLFKTHEGELVELQGWWELGTEEFPPDELFDPQFASNQQDFLLCKDLDKGASERSRYSADYRRVESMSKGKGKPPVGDPAVGGKVGLPAGGGKGKGKSIITSNVLQVSPDGTWHVRCGTCMSLAQLFAAFGKQWTAAKLYKYYNELALLACKRPHAWGNPVRQAASRQRYFETGKRGHG